MATSALEYMTRQQLADMVLHAKAVEINGLFTTRLLEQMRHSGANAPSLGTPKA